MKKVNFFAFGLILIFFSLFSTSCSREKKSLLDPKNPVTVTIWNYYNGYQLVAFEKLVEEFNLTVGADKGIVAISVSQGNIATLADALIASVQGKVGSAVPPTLAAVYSETAFILNKLDALAPLEPYFSNKELEEFIPSFIDEGRFNEKNNLLLFPTSKSTEVFAVNTTDWENFAKATGIEVSDIKTIEDLTSAAKKYYEWTDSLTPDIQEDGKALYGRDSIANYIYLGACQLGHEVFVVKNGKMTMDFDRKTFKTLWDNYYIPFINGYFGAYANFRSEDVKIGKILSLTSSSSGVSYLPQEVVLLDDSIHPIEMQISDILFFKDAKNKEVVQQGAGYCLIKSDEAVQEGAVEFLKWFVKPERNKDFSFMSCYSPVTKAANMKEAIADAYANKTLSKKDKMRYESLLVSADLYSTYKAHVSKPFDGAKEMRTILEDSLKNKAVNDRKAVEKEIASGKTREEAVAPFITDSYFDEWLTNLKAQCEKVIQ